jgi:hypothetical protein
MDPDGAGSFQAYLRRIWVYLVAIAVFAIADGVLSTMSSTVALVLQGVAIVFMLASLGGLILAARRKSS